MIISFELNGKKVSSDITADTTLLELLRKMDCHSVRSGCDTTNCGICTVWVNEVPVLSCAYTAARVDGQKVTTVEGVIDEAEDLLQELADEGAEQCGFCSPGFIMSALALLRDYPNATEQEILDYLAGNLCRCTGYVSQTRAIMKVIQRRHEHA